MKKASSNDSEVELYLEEISKFKLLTQDEERSLARRIAESDAEARDIMIRSNLRLVVSIAKHYTGRGMALLDLIEEGNLGLLKAVTRFSPDEGCKFSTYASWWIKQCIRRALINKVRPVRVPAYMVEVMGHWRKTIALLSQKLGREPSTEEVAKHLMEVRPDLKLTKSKIQMIDKALHASAPTAGGSGEMRSVDLEDLLAGVPSPVAAESLLQYDRETIQQALELALTERERGIVEMRYGFGKNTGDALTLERIGERIGLTRERVRQLEKQALAKLAIFLRHHDETEEYIRNERIKNRDNREIRVRPPSNAKINPPV